MNYLKNELQGFVPTQTAQNIIKQTVRGSSILRLAKVEPMTSDKKKIPVFAGGAGAYWVGEGQRIQTTTAQWIFPELEAKKLAVIIPVTKEKLEDSTIDVFAELEEVIAEAFHTAIDAAGLFGTSSPFATNLLSSATENNNVVENIGDLDLVISDTMADVENNGFDVDGFAAHISVKNSLRKLRDANGAPKFVDSQDGRKFYEQPIEFVRNNSWDKTKALLFAGEWRYALVGMRSDISYDILKEATLQNVVDTDGKPLSLAEQDMIGIKATMRLGFLVVKPDAFSVVTPGTTKVTTGDSTAITAKGATISATITNAGTKVTASGIAYALTSEAAEPTLKKTGTAKQNGAYSVTLSGLTAETTYFARAYVIADGITVYGNEVTFSTTAVAGA